jgi:hypothetical protein
MSSDNKRHPEPELTAKKMIPTQEYGLLKSFEFPDGTVISINTKKGEENMRIYHSSGSYHEFRTDGTHIHFSSNNIVQYQKGGATITWDNNHDIKGDGHARISINHDAHIEVAKNASIAVNGRGDVHSTGHIKLSAADIQLSTTEGSICFAAERDIEFFAKGGRILAHSKNAMQLSTEAGDIHLESAADIIQNAAGDIRPTAQGKLVANSGGNMVLTTQQKFKTKASDDLILDSDQNIKVGASKNYIEQTDKGSTIEASSIPPTQKITEDVDA